MVAARARAIYDRQARERMQETLKQNSTAKENLPERTHGQSRDMAGKALGVSGKTVDYATKVLRQGEPELIKAVVCPVSGVSQGISRLDQLSKSFSSCSVASRISQPAKAQFTRLMGSLPHSAISMTGWL